MNSVNLIGRLVRDPVLRYSGELPVVNFSIAIERGKKDGTKTTDFPKIIALGKTGELVDKYLHKGQLVGISGRLQTGSYERDGMKIYTTEVVADRVTFVEWPKEEKSEFEQITDNDIPF